MLPVSTCPRLAWDWVIFWAKMAYRLKGVSNVSKKKPIPARLNPNGRDSPAIVSERWI